MDVENIMMDKSSLFLSDGVAVDTSIDVNSDYKEFFDNHGISEADNYVLEREFRNRVTDFLYDGKPKVFKSDTEGLILVKISGSIINTKVRIGKKNIRSLLHNDRDWKSRFRHSN